MRQSHRNNHTMTADLTNVTHAESQRQPESHRSQLWYHRDLQNSKSLSNTYYVFPGSLWNSKGPPERCYIPRHPQKQWHSDTVTEHSQTYWESIPESPTGHCQSGNQKRSLQGVSWIRRTVCTHTNTTPHEKGPAKLGIWYKNSLLQKKFNRNA